MTPPLDRRDFLRTTGLAAAGAAAGIAAGSLPRAVSAIEPIQRNGHPKFKFSLAAYSYRNLLMGQPPQMTLDDFIADCAAMQLEGTELTSYYFPTDLTNDYLIRLKELCFRLGLDVSGTAVGNDFCHPPGEERDKQIAHVKSWVDHAAVLGAPVIRIFSGSVKDGQSESEARGLAIAAIEECCDYAGRQGIYLALENHGGLTVQVDGILSLVKDVNSPWFAVNLDTGNFHGADVYADLAQLAPYAMNVQVKVVVQPEGGSRQPSDFSKLHKLLSEAGYRGYIVLEYEEAEDPRVACPRFIDELRQAFA